MKALLIYVTFVLIGVALSILVGIYVERQTSSAVSLIVFLSMFFSNFAACWILTILVMDGSLKNGQGRQEQRDAEKIGRVAMIDARAKQAA